MNRSVTFLIALVAVVVSVPVFAASTATATLNVTASVSTVCTISTTPVAFGAYDPVVANNTTGADIDAQGTVVVACTKNAANVWIDLNGGGHAAGTAFGTRAMNGPGAAGVELLGYDLFKDAGRSTVWSTGQNTGGVQYAPASKAAFTETVYGRLFKGQDISAGAYADAVTATINY
ncbi:MAG TPA: spore coat U domain-containing protein [Thermoanaerobaculia bacterium]